MSPSLVLRKIVGGVLSGIAALAISFAGARSLHATPLQDADLSASRVVAAPNTVLDTSASSTIDEVPAIQPSLPDELGGPAVSPAQQEFAGAFAGAQNAISGDPFLGLSNLTIDDHGPRLHNSPDFLHPATKAENSKAWSFGTSPADTAVRRASSEAPGFPGIVEFIFDSPESLKTLQDWTDLKRSGQHAIDFSIFGGVQFMLERLPDSQGVVIREKTTGSELALHRVAASADAAAAQGPGDDGGDHMTAETNFGRLVLDWAIEQLTSPLGVLVSMFTGVVLGIWGIANSIIVFRRRVRHQSNAL